MMLGEATKRTACSVSRSVDDSTTWVREKRRSVILHANPYKQHRDINISINYLFQQSIISVIMNYKVNQYKKEIAFLPQAQIFFQLTLCNPMSFQTMNSVRLNIVSSKYQRFTPSGCTDIEIKKFDSKTSYIKSNYQTVNQSLIQPIIYLLGCPTIDQSVILLSS